MFVFFFSFFSFSSFFFLLFFLLFFFFFFQTFWKHHHILCYHLSISDHKRLCWIWCIWRKIAQMHLFITSFSWKYDSYRHYIPVYTEGSRDGNSLVCGTVFLSNTIISMRLPDSASIFTAEIWAIIKALEERNSIVSKYFVFTDSLSCLQALQSMKLEHPLIGMVIRKCLFLKFDNKNIIFCWVLALEVTKKQTLVSMLHCYFFSIIILYCRSKGRGMCYPVCGMMHIK